MTLSGTGPGNKFPSRDGTATGSFRCGAPLLYAILGVRCARLPVIGQTPVEGPFLGGSRKTWRRIESQRDGVRHSAAMLS